MYRLATLPMRREELRLAVWPHARVWYGQRTRRASEPTAISRPELQPGHCSASGDGTRSPSSGFDVGRALLAAGNQVWRWKPACIDDVTAQAIDAECPIARKAEVEALGLREEADGYSLGQEKVQMRRPEKVCPCREPALDPL